MYKHYDKKMSRLFLLLSLFVLCVLYTPSFATKAYAQTQQATENQISETDHALKSKISQALESETDHALKSKINQALESKTDHSLKSKIDHGLEVLKKESDMTWSETIQEKLDSTPSKKAHHPKRKRAAWNSSSKITGTYPETPGMILVTKDWYKGILPLGHAAMVYNKRKVVEALEYGVALGDNDWYESRKTAFGLKVRNTSEKQDKVAAEWCKKQINKPYNFAYWKPDRRDAFYCSQLVWAAYKDIYNIEIVEPRSFLFFHAIYPPDLIKSKALKEVYAKIT